MNTQSLLVFSFSMVLLFSVWLLLLMRVPRMMMSLFRYRLWSLRDRVVDDMLRGHLPRNPATERFVQMIEGTIRHANCISLLRFAMIPAVPKEITEQHKRLVDAALAEMSPESKSAYAKYESELMNILGHHMVFGSFFGWAVLTVGVLVVGIVRLAKEMCWKAELACCLVVACKPLWT